LAVVKFARTWNVWPNEPSLRNGWLRLAVMTGYLPLLIGGIIGAWWFRDRGWSCALCILPAVYFAGLHMIFVGSIRYRQPAMLPLTVLAAGVAAELLRSWRRQATSPEPPA
jgi:ATP/ADP translocase